MILYDQERKLLAISDELIDFLGFNSIDEIKKSINDIADLFEEKPGYIYNFKNFSWISYIISNPLKEHKAILNLKENNIEINLSIKTLISWDNKSNYYLVSLSPIEATFSDNNLKSSYDNIFSNEIEDEQQNLNLEETFSNKEPKEEDLNIDIENLLKESKTKEEIHPIDTIEEKLSQEQEEKQININFNELLKESLPEEKNVDLSLTKETESAEQLVEEKETQTEQESIYDYKKASKELEIDEEFLKELVYEFIDQAEELKDKIFDSLENGDTEKAHTLFHKIKGAAANLRIEQANEILSATRGEDDIDKLKVIANDFYEFLDKFKDYVLEKPKKEETQEAKEESFNINLEDLLKESEKEKEDIENKMKETVLEIEEKQTPEAKEEIHPPIEKESELNIDIDIDALLKENKEESEKEPSLETKEKENIQESIEESQPANIDLNINLEDLLKESKEEKNLVLEAEEKEESQKAIEEISENLLPKPEIEENLLPAIEISKEDTKIKEELEENLLIPYDIETAQKDLGLSKEIILDFVKDYIEDTKKQKDRLNELIEKKDTKELRNTVHKLKGSATNLHINKVVEILNIIQTEINNQNFDKIKEYFNNLFKYLSYLENEISQKENKELKKSAAEIGLDLSSYNKFINDFLDELKDLATIQQPEKIKKEAVKLKSIAENLRLERFSEILNKIIEEKEYQEDIKGLSLAADNFRKEIL